MNPYSLIGRDKTRGMSKRRFYSKGQIPIDQLASRGQGFLFILGCSGSFLCNCNLVCVGKKEDEPIGLCVGGYCVGACIITQSPKQLHLSYFRKQTLVGGSAAQCVTELNTKKAKW